MTVKKHNLTNTFCLVAHPPSHGGQCRLCSECHLFIAPSEFDFECAAQGECGIAPFSTGQDDIYDPACDAHDMWYGPNSPLKNKGREFSDKNFLYEMQEISNSAKWYIRPWLKVKELGYYALARMLGRDAWNNNE